MPSAQWELRESSGNHELERCRNAMKLGRNAKVAMRTPWHHYIQENMKFRCDLKALWEI